MKLICNYGQGELRVKWSIYEHQEVAGEKTSGSGFRLKWERGGKDTAVQVPGRNVDNGCQILFSKYFFKHLVFNMQGVCVSLCALKRIQSRNSLEYS